MRRQYEPGHCQDCGNERRVTWGTSWLNGLRMRLCAPCVRVYRRVILR